MHVEHTTETALEPRPSKWRGSERVMMYVRIVIYLNHKAQVKSNHIYPSPPHRLRDAFFALDSHKRVDIVYTDFTKASHRIIVPLTNV